MLKELKAILNSLNDEELSTNTLWVNAIDLVDSILVEKGAIVLITDTAEVKINDLIEKEKTTIYINEDK